MSQQLNIFNFLHLKFLCWRKCHHYGLNLDKTNCNQKLIKVRNVKQVLICLDNHVNKLARISLKIIKNKFLLSEPATRHFKIIKVNVYDLLCVILYNKKQTTTNKCKE